MTDAPHAEFARRLHRALDTSGFAVGRRRTGALSEFYGVSRETARKWLGGLALPELDRMIRLATDQRVSFEWFSTGRGTAQAGQFAVREPQGKYGETEDARLFALIRKLPRKQRRALLVLLDPP